ncbi:MAG TPA: serine/threonine-protein kinase [Pyrinomonadaceae bacterium]
MLAPNTLLQNRYLIVRSIGHGGMGAVYLARDQRLGHTVALKETFFSEERMRRAFVREARLLAHLRHPALPKVTDHFDEEGGQFIVMEFIPGEDLEILLAQRGKPFPPAQVLGWADGLLKALDYLHGQEPPILHRDIKPANLKLTPEGEVILLDFGLAKGTAGQTPSVLTSRSVFGFTPNFAPLEQIQGTGTGPRSDLYSLAATLYYLMTGVIPPDALARITEVANGQPDPLRSPDEVNSEIPPALAGILMRTMAHNRDQRPASAAELRRMLSEAGASLPAAVAAAEPSTTAYAALPVDGQAADDNRADLALLPSTLVEAPLPGETLAPRETGAVAPAAPSIAASPATAGAAQPETVPDRASALPSRESAPLAKPERKGLRLPWLATGFAALLLAAITFGLLSGFRSDKSAAGPAGPLAKDADARAAASVPAESPVAAPDDSEITSAVDADGVKTQTRTFRNNARLLKVVVTTRDGKQAAEAYLANGQRRVLPDERVASALLASGDLIADAVGFSGENGTPAEKTKVAAQKTVSPPKTSAQRKASGTAPASTEPTRTRMATGPNATEQKAATNENNPAQGVESPPKKGGAQPRALTKF